MLQDSRRKIALVNDYIQLLKIAEDNGNGLIWHSHGKRVEIKGAYDLVKRGDPYQIIEIDRYVAGRLEQRAEQRGEDITFKLEGIIK